ncbi:Sphinganine C(4)-monooxygenase 2 [Acorus gramineus]|uniref:aldehyde oxygenase (deformylating) n=1 Tax=Acorus gramineus TaxID=55184 RepID=A0AAV9AQQ8_ACOGR|nr:Sphinganine C(4)-monooxygenase 2 [Acorus gramineus]
MSSLVLSDEILAIYVPILVYWLYSSFYMILGSTKKYRLHSYEEEDQKNLVSKREAIKGVLLQQIVQVIVAFLMFKVLHFNLLAFQQTSIIYMSKQFIIAALAFDAWQYFMHRYMHHNRFLYKHVHSYHHRLVAPYAFASQYNHPLEGLLLDTLGGAVSFVVSGMSPRASIFFFSFTTIRGIDVHCGLIVPWNPLHVLFGDQTVHHDMHHQLYGTKYNFSQPFFTFWDRVLGTHMGCTVEKRLGGGFEARPVKSLKG